MPEYPPGVKNRLPPATAALLREGASGRGGEELTVEAFLEFGNRLDAKWRRSGYDEREFPALTADLMRSEGILGRIDVQDVLRHAACGGRFDSLQSDSAFGDLSYIVFNNRRFYLEVLVWTTNDTTIHDHAFSGAFGIIRGDSLCVTYGFERSARINSRFKIGDLVVRRCEHLNPGDVRPILEAPGLIHALHHLTVPTATLVVRTPGNPDAQPQFNYCPSGIAAAAKGMEVVPRKAWQALDIMLQADYAKGEEWALRALEQAPIDARYRIVRNLNYDALPAGFSTRVRDFLAGMPFGTRMWDSPQAQKDRTFMARMGNRLRSPHLRMFWALVMNVPDRDHVADFWRRELTEAGCRSGVARYVEELEGEGLLRWKDDGELPGIVCSHLFERSEGARRQLAESGNLFLRFLAR